MDIEVISYNNKGGTASIAVTVPLSIDILTKEIFLSIDDTLIIKENKLSVANAIPSITDNKGKGLFTDGVTLYWDNLTSYTQKEIDDFFGGITPISGYNLELWDKAYKHTLETDNVHGINLSNIVYKSGDNQFTGTNNFIGELDVLTIDINNTLSTIPVYKEGRFFYNFNTKKIASYGDVVDLVLNYSIDGHTHFQLYQPNGLNPFVYTDDLGRLHIDGDIIQTGTTFETHAEHVLTKQDVITLRDGAISGLIPGQYVGIKALKYDGTNDGQLVFDKTGTARVGDVGSEQPITTRIESPTNGKFAIWDNDNSRLDFKDIALSDLPTISYPELLRGSYRYDSQILGVDTIGDWRTYSDDLGYYTQYCTVGGTRATSTWVTKNTIIT